MYQYTLGYHNNEIVHIFSEKYFSGLCEFLRDKIDKDLCVREFILIPDISTTIEYMRINPDFIQEGIKFI